MTSPIRTEADLLAIEADGLDAFLPAASPAAILRRSAALWPDAIAIRYLPGGDRPDVSVTFATLFALVCRAASLFRRLGAGPGRPVALFMPHTLNTQIALWGAELAGMACPINPMLNGESITALVRACGARVAVVLGVNADVDVWARVSAAVREADPAITILDADGDAASPGRDGGFEALLDAEADADLPDPDPDAIASLYPTGGTTGAPKLTMHTHRNEAFSSTAASHMFDLQPGETMLNGFPLFHVAGAFVYGLSSIVAGVAQVVLGRLGMRNRAFLNTLWQQAEHYRITVLAVVPTVLTSLLTVPFPPGGRGPVRVAYTGGSKLPTELANAFEARTGVPVRNILGMTECAGIITIEPFHAPRTPDSTGLRMPFCSVHVERLGTTEQAAPNEPGIVVTRGPNVSPGYFRKTDPTFRPDGTLVSGDIGHKDEAGRLFVTGRSKDVIIRGSHNIDPASIEDALLRHQAVADAAAVGLPDRYAGELPVVFVTLKPDAEVPQFEIEAFASAHVPEPAARPKQVWVIDAMPLTPVGKIFKPALRALAVRQAISATLAALDSPPKLVRIENGESPTDWTIHVADLAAGAETRLQSALNFLPFPVRFARA
jgi:fatty-acyl-CoA synthase